MQLMPRNLIAAVEALSAEQDPQDFAFVPGTETDR
jgi:hypothetical protein